MDQVQHDRILSYLRTRKLPERFTRNEMQKSKDFVVEGGQLFYKRNRVKVITESQKERILEMCHSSGPNANHLDRRKTQDVVSKSYYWPQMEADVREFCQSCELCKGGSRSGKKGHAQEKRDEGNTTPRRSLTPNATSQPVITQEKQDEERRNTTPRKSQMANVTSRGASPQPEKQEGFWTRRFKTVHSYWKRATGQIDVEQSTTLESTDVANAAVIDQDTEEHSITDLGPNLCALCAIGDIEAIKTHLENPDTDVNVTDSTGETPLHKACNSGDHEVMKLLLEQNGIEICPKSDNGQTPLHIASKLGNLEVAQLLLDAEPDMNKAKCNINTPDSNGLTPLCYSAKFHPRSNDMVNFLLERGADLSSSLRSAATCSAWKTKDAEYLIELCGGLTQNMETIFEALISVGGSKYCSITDESGNSLLHIAARNGHQEFVLQLIQAKAMIDAENEDSKTPLHFAIEAGNTEIVDILLEHNAKLTAVKESRVTALHMAVKQEATGFQILRALLRRQTDASSINSRDINMQTPLHYAAVSCGGRPHVIELLLESGAELDAEDKDGFTPLMLAAAKKCGRTFDLLVETKDGPRVVKNTLLFLAQAQLQSINHPTTVSKPLQDLLAMRNIVEHLSCTDDSGDTPLHIAAGSNYVGAVNLLLTKGVGCNPKNNMGRTPLHLAAERGCDGSVEVLINEDTCNRLAKDTFGMTPLHVAAENNNVSIVKLLAESMKCNSKNHIGRTALHLAAAKGYSIIAQELIVEGKCDISPEDDDGMTPLHIVCQNGHVKLAKFLLANKADVDHEDTQGHTPLNHAVRNCHKDIIRLLILNGASFRSAFINTAKHQERLQMIEAYGNEEVKKAVFEAVRGGEEDKSLEFLKLLMTSTGNRFCNSFCIDRRSGNTPLHIAASFGYVQTVELVLQAEEKQGPYKHCVEVENIDKKTPVHIAAEKGYVEVVVQLISYHRRNRIQCKFGTLTPMHLACQNGHEQVVEEIAKMVPEWVNSSDASIDMRTPLHVASENGYVKVVEILVNHNAKLKAMKDGSTPIHVAVKKGYIEVVRVLLSAYPDEVNTADMKRKTPLHLAARYCEDHSNIVTELLNSGANVGALDSTNYTPLMVAAAWENNALVREMMDKDISAVEKTLLNAAYLCDTASLNFIRLILKSRISGEHPCLDCKDQDGNTILHIAASTGKAELIELILEQKFDIKWDPLNTKQKTPLHLATEKGHHLIVRQLLKQHPEVVNTSDSNGFTALHCACQNNLLKVVKAFEEQLDSEIVREAQTHEHDTPLHIACMNGGDKSLDVVNFLIEKNANVHAANEDGETPIHISASGGYRQLTNILLEKGANAEVRDAKGCTPVILAAIGDHKPVISLLLPKTNLRKSVTSARVLTQSEDVLSRLLGASSDKRLKEEVLSAVLDNDADFIEILADETGTKYLAKPVDDDKNTLLHFAASYGHHKIVEALLGARPKSNQWFWQKEDVQVDAENINHITPLHLAAEQGHFQVVSILLTHQSKFKTGGLTPMHLACRRGHYDVVKKIASLVQVWIDAANSNEDRYTPLHIACEHSYKDIVCILLEHGAKVSFTKEERLSPVHLAVRNGFTDGLKILLKERPDSVNWKDKQHRTPLHYAGEHCHNSGIIALLLERQGKLNMEAVDKEGFTPILTAAARGNYDAFNAMVDIGGDALKIALFQAAKCPNQPNIRALKVISSSKVCRFSVCYESRDEDGNTPLHTSARHGNLQAVEVFLEWQYRNQQEKGLELVQNAEGKTPAHVAAEYNHSNVLKVLISQCDHDVSKVKDKSGKTILHLACQEGHLDTVLAIDSLFVNDAEKLSNIYELCDNEGNTLLHLACQYQKENVVRHLINKRGAKIDARSKYKDGEAPIHIAAQFQSKKIINILLENGADIESKDANGCTPLHHAARCNQRDMVQYLRKSHGANLDAESVMFIAPLIMAAQHECINTFQCLMHLMDRPTRCVFKVLELAVDHGQILRFMLTNGVYGRTLRQATDDNQNTLLHVAALHGKLKAIETLMDLQLPAKVKNVESKTAMHLAALNGHASVVKEMIARKPSLAKEIDEKGMTPLHCACQQGDFEVVKVHESLLDEEVVLEAEDSDCNTPLHLSCRSQSVQIINYLISKGANLNATNIMKLTPLHIATKCGYIMVAEILVEEGAEVNSQDERRCTPLHYAAEENSTELVHLLCKGGAILSAENSNSLTPVLTAVDHKQTEAFHCLMKYVDMGSVTENPAFKVLALPNHEILEFLVNDSEWGMKLLQATDKFQNTPLHDASQRGDLQSVKIFLHHNCAARAKNKDGKLSIHLAAEHGYYKIVEEFIHYDPKLMMACDNRKWTSLHIASQCGHLEVVRVINGSKEFEVLKAADENGNTPLHVACEFGKKDIVEFLIACGANITAVNSRGEIPLHIASQHKSVDIVKLLLDNGGPKMIEQMDNQGYISLHHAAENNQTNQIKFLHQRGADVYAEDQMLCTPVLIAAAFNSVNAFRCLLGFMDLKNAEKNPIFTALHVKMHRAEILSFLIMDTEYGNSLCESTDRYKNGVLHIIARENDLAAMAVLMKHRVKSDVKNMDGKTPMHLAAEKGHHDSVQKLMTYNSSLVTAKDNHAMTPLHLACLNGYIRVVQVHSDQSFLRSKGLCEKRNAKGNTPLHLACTGGSIDIVKLLIHNEADTMAANKQNETPLHVAVHCGHAPIARFLINLKVPTECRTLEGHTPLHYAARKNNTDTIMLLIESGADLYAKDNNLCTPTHSAVMHQCVDAYYCLMNHIVQASIIFMAFEVKCNRPILLKSMLDDSKYGEKLCHATDDTGHTPLHIACGLGDSEAVSILLDHRACADAQNGDLETPMHLAAGRGLVCVVQQLISHNPKLMLGKDSGERTPVHTACLNGHTEVVRICVQSLNKLLEATDVNVLEVTDTNGNTPLHLACVGGNVNVVQLLLDNGASITAANSQGEAPIHTASQHKSVEIVKQLLDKGDHTMIELMDGRGFTALHHAAKNNQTKIINFLHQHGANVYAEDQSLCTPVLIAAANKNIKAFHCLMQFMNLQDDQKNPVFKALNVTLHREEILHFLITEPVWGATLVKSTDNQKNCVLHITARENDLLAMAVLMAQKVESCIKNADGKTPMHLAAESGHHEVVLQLMMYDSKLVMSKDNCGMTPLHLACLHGHVEIVQIQKKHSWLKSESLCEHHDSEGNTPFHLGCAGGSVGVVELLIDSKVNAMATNNLNETPLHIAVRHRHVHIAQVLLNMEVSTECQTLEGHTPLHYAAKENDADMIRLLVESGADLDAKDINCCTPTHIAAMHQCVDAYHCLMENIPDNEHASVIFASFEAKCNREIILKFLVSDCKYGEKLCNAANDTEHTPLHIASECGNQEAVNILLQHGACGNAQNSKLETPMHLAAGKGLEHIVKQLIDHDVKLMLCEDNEKRTPLHTACLNGHVEVVRIYTQSHLLLQATGANVLDVTDGNGNTPLHLACVGGNVNVVQLMVDGGASITAANSQGEAPIHTASQHKSVEIVELLLGKSDHTMIELKDGRGFTALHHAAQNNQTNIIIFLHQHGADVYAEDQNLCTPVLIAAASKNTEAFHCLMKLMDLQDDQKNPVFKTLRVKLHRTEMLHFLITDSVWGATLVKSTDNQKNCVLHITARENDLSALAVLVAAKVDSCIKNADRKTPMHLAAENGHHEVVLQLMMYDSKLVTSEDNCGMTPLHLACLHGHVEVVQIHKNDLWLNCESLREHHDAEGNTPFHLGCAGGSVGVVELLIDSKVNAMATNNLNEAPLHIAVRHRHVHVAQVLLNMEVSTECQTLDGHTPLHYAAKENDADMIRLLVEGGADLDAKDINCCTPTHIAAIHECVDAYHCLMEHIPDNEHPSVIFTSFEVNYSREIILKFLVSDRKYGEKLCNAANDTEHTPLHIASELGNQEAVNILLQYGACGNAQNTNLETPMHLAAGKGLEHIVKLLIDHDLKLMLCKDNRERTSLHTACRHGQTDVVMVHTQSLKLLLEATGTNLLEDTDSMGNTPLHLACVGGSRDSVQLLINSNASLHPMNIRGEAPIHIAAQHGFVPIAEVLLANEVDIECLSGLEECTPLHHAAKCNQNEMIRFLCRQCANIHAEDCNFCTPVLLAASCSRTCAFDCLMGYLDLEDIKGNPIFQVLKIKSRQETILKFLINNHSWGLKLRHSTAEHGNNPLHVAAYQGNNLAVKVMLDEGFDARAKNVFQKRPLHLAAEEGHPMVVKTFISYDSSLATDRDENGMIPLHLASLCGKLEAVKAHESQLSLVKVREARDSELNTPLTLACKRGNKEVAEYLIEVGCSRNAKNLKKDSLIHVAVQNGHVGVTELLLDKGVSTESLDAQKCTPVHIAAKCNQTNIIKLLKARGADLFSEDCASFTPVLAAAVHMKTAAVHMKTAAFHCLMEYVTMNDPKQNPMFKAIEIRCSWEVILNFLCRDVKWGSKLQQSTDFNKNTPLHAAARHGNVVAVKVLLQLNFDTYAKNCDGQLPIHLAAEEGHFNAVLEFIHHDPQLTVAQDANGRIPLHTACLSGHVEVVKTFNLSINEVLHASDSNGNTPLHLACEGRSEDVVQFLIDSGASVTEANNEGEVPTHIAAQNGSVNIVERLWKRCAGTVSCQDKYKHTTLHHAAMAKHNHGEIIDFVIKKCALTHSGDTSLYAEDQNSHTPILMAAAHRQVTAFRWFMKHIDLESSERNPVFKILHVKSKQAEILEFMISDSDWGTKLSAAEDESGNTPLHVAARDGNQKAVSVLLKLKVKVNALNIHGKTPIHLAAECGQHVTVQQLNKYDRTLVEDQDADGRNALHLACQGGHWGVVSVLCVRMSEQVREACDSKGNNRPLHLACESNSASIVNLLIDMKADTTAKNGMDEIPLHIAAKNGNVQIGRLLVAGAKIKDSRGFNSLHNAAYHNQTKMITFLCDSDKSQTLLYDKDNNHCTPVLIAAASVNEDAFHCLMEYVDLGDPKKNPIFMAFHAQYKKTAILKFMINDVKWGENLSQSTTEDGRTPLHLAAEMGNIEITDLLISKYRELVYVKDISGMIPLHLACCSGEAEIVKAHISKLEGSFMVVCEAQDNGGNTPLHYACENDSPYIVKLLIENGAVKTTQNNQMEASIHIAAKSGFIDTAEILLDDGISTEIEGNQNYTPLHYAAENNHREMIRMLCNRDAELYAEDKDSYIPVMVAARCKRTEAFHCLMEYMMNLEGAKKNPLFKVLALKADLVLEFMVENKDWCQRLCETSDDDGNTPLHIAATQGNIMAVQLLIEHKAKTDSVNRDVKTPMHLAAEKGYYRIASDLLHSNPSLIMKADNEGKSPLHLACQHGHLTIVNCILESQLYSKGVLEACDKKKNTAMHLACMGGNCDIVELLIEKGAKTHAANEKKRTPIHTASKYGFVSIVKTLERREPIKCWDYCKRTPLHLAAKYNRVEVIEFLHERHLQCAEATSIPRDSDLHAVDDYGYTPVVLAAVSGDRKANSQAFQFLMQYIGGDIQDVAKNPLFQALKVGDTALPAVKYMIRDTDWNKKVCEVTDFQNTPMHVAAMTGLPHIVEEFLNHELTKKMLKARNIRNMTALHLACQEGQHEVVTKLEPHLNAEDVKQEDREKNTALHLACEGGIKETVQLLLNKGEGIEGLTDVRNVRDEAPIHFAARYGYEDIADLLLEKGVAIDTRDIHGCTPLHHAARNDQEKMIHFLCMRDQNLITLEDHDSHTPILTAAARSKVKAFRCLMGYQQRLKENPVFRALESKENPIAILKSMINDSTWGSKLRRATDGAGNTPLHVAAKYDNLAAIKLLLEGDSPSREMYLVNNSGKTPMHMAAEGGHINVVGELIHYQSNTKELRDQDDNTPLHLACMNGHLEVARMLFVPRLLSATNGQGNTPLHLSCMKKGNIGIVKDLIAAVRSDAGQVYRLLNKRNAKNQTPLDLAYQMEDPDTSIVLHLIEQGADVRLKPVFEMLPEAHGGFNFLDWAIERKHRDIARKIVESEYWEDALRSCHVEEGHPAEVTSASHPTEFNPPTELIPDHSAEDPDALTPENCPVEINQGSPHAEVNQGSCPAGINQYIRPNYEVHPQSRPIETTPFRKLIEEMPDVAHKVMDRSREKEKYTFEFLEDFKPAPWHCCRRPKHNDEEQRLQDENDHWGPKNFERSNHPLAIMVKHQRSELLKHELVSTFLRHKFTRFGAAFYLVDLLLYIFFLVFLTSYALIVPTPLDDIYWRTFLSTYLLATFTIMFAAIRLLLQLFELCMLMVRYCRHLRDCKWHYNWKEFLSRTFYGIVRFLLFVFAIAFASVFNSHCPCISNGQWQVGVLAVFLGWINMITFIKLVPRLGVYVLMFLNVIYSFLKMLILGFLLVMAFGLAFYMLFRTPSQMRTPFATPGLALIKTMTMPLANFDFDGMFHLSDDEDEIPYLEASHLLWIVFVVILPVLFLNLLTSVAVGDIQEVRQNTLLRQRELHVELLLNLEELVPPIVGDTNEQHSKTYRIFEWLWEVTSGESKVEQVHPLEHKVEQTLSEIDGVRSTLSEHSRKLEETESLVKQVAGQHEVQETITQQTSEKLETIKEQLANIERKFCVPAAAPHEARRKSL